MTGEMAQGLRNRFEDAPATLETLVCDPCLPGEELGHWQELADRSLDPNPFFGPQFLIPFLEDTGRKGVRLAVIRDSQTGRWLMAAPVGRRKLGFVLKAASLWATEYGPLGVPLIAPEAPEETCSLFAGHVARLTGLPLVAFPYLPLNSLSAGRIMEGVPGVRIAHEAVRAAHDGGELGAAQFAGAYTVRRRKEFSRLIRRLEDKGTLEFRSLSGEEAVPAFEQFLQLEASGWKGTRGSALLSHPETVRFARTMIATKARGDGVRIDGVFLSGEPIAMLVLLIDGGRAFSWKIAYDEAYARYSPGAQATLFALERSLADPSITGGDSLAVPGHKMIEPLWRGRMSYGTLLCAVGPAGTLMRGLGRLDLAAEQGLRRMARKLLRR